MVEYIIMVSEGDVCPECGACLELLVDLEDQYAPVHAERCQENWDHLDNVFVTGAEWPEVE